VILSIIQVTPVKINPWSWIARNVGKALTADVLDKLSENEADTARYRIIRFDDEIRHETRHSEEHFNQILSDIDRYEKYCASHPKYPNNKAVMAIEKIKKTYAKCKDENSFI
jgi:excinuclease UvrABC helicase subunit UvrB